MFEEMLVPLLLTATMGEIRGKTRFQKLIFLIQKEAMRIGIDSLNIDYEIYHYGPFSMELTSIIKRLLVHRLLKENTEITATGYIVYKYALTDKGERLLQNAIEKGILSTELAQIVEQIARKYGNLPLPQLIQEAYTQY